MSIAIFCALNEEIKPLLKQMVVRSTVKERGRTLYRARMGAEEIYLLKSGPGKKNAQRAVHAFLEQYQPAHVFICGFAGALSDDLAVGDLLLVDRVHSKEEDITKELLCDRALFEQFQKMSYHQTSSYQGTLLTVPKVVRYAREKKNLFEKEGALAVDMESFYMMKIIADKKVPCNVVRVISDTSHENLDFDFNRFLKEGGGLRIFPLLAHCIKNPKKFKSLFRLSRTARRASNNLANFMSQILYQLTIK
ncbi:MAG: hypothetical protein Q8Q33_10435 [Chlamydiota bacterium]|nr:hypothetical protein [Chlamydiota bacterium]